MKRSRRLTILIIGSTVLIAVASCNRQTARNRLDESQFPPVMLWAWERPEDLSFLDSHHYGVAYLAQTLTLKGDEVVFNPRHQPLKTSPDAKVMAVTRIESQKITGQRPALSPNQRQQLVKLILRTLEPGRVSAIQIDFDALVSERDFYRAFLQDLRDRSRVQKPVRRSRSESPRRDRVPAFAESTLLAAVFDLVTEPVFGQLSFAIQFGSRPSPSHRVT